MEPTTEVSITVNGVPVTRQVSGRTLLVNFLRETLQLTGTHVGCDTSQCGACTVHLDGSPIKSCTIFAAQADGHAVTTIEGLDPAGQHPLQIAFHEHHGLQCGYCTPGMIMAAVPLLSAGPALTDAAIREGLEGNLCRCTGYQPIIAAIQSAAGNGADR